MYYIGVWTADILQRIIQTDFVYILILLYIIVFKKHLKSVDAIGPDLLMGT